MTGCTNIDGLAGKVHIFSLSIAEFTVPQNTKGTIILIAVMNTTYSGFSHALAPYV